MPKSNLTPTPQQRIGLCGLILVAVLGCTQNDSAPTQNVETTNSPGSGTPVTATTSTASPGESSPLRFEDVTQQSGIEFVHVSGDSKEKPFPAADGSGVAAIDLDVDGLDDLVFLNGTTFPISHSPTGPHDSCYRNLGSLRFVDVTSPTGLGSTGYSAGAAVGDFNSDGFPDLFVNCFGDDLLYLNQGDGTFTECAQTSGASDPLWGTSALFLDFDFDGDLDLYVCNYAEWSWETNTFCGDRQKGIRIFCSPRTVKPVPDRLFENLGDGTFVDALEKAGLNRSPARSQGVVCADVDNDGLPDLYIGNDLNPNSLFKSKGDGTFEDLSDVSGAGVDFAGQIQAGMGVDVADVDRDGAVEIFVTNYEGEHNTLYKNLGGAMFQDSSQSEGVAAPSMRWVGWGTSFVDFDLDGWPDLVVTNGHTDNNLKDIGRDGQYEQPPLLFHNSNGRLRLVTSSPDNYFSQDHPGRSLCVSDLDLDFRPDLIMGHKDQRPAILRNGASAAKSDERTAIRFNVIGTQSNRSAIGFQAEVENQDRTSRYQLKSGGSYLASHTHSLIITMSRSGRSTPARIRWPTDNPEQAVELPVASGTYSLLEGREDTIYEMPAPRNSLWNP